MAVTAIPNLQAYIDDALIGLEEKLPGPSHPQPDEELQG